MTIKPENLFRKAILDFPVKTKRLGKVRYVNFDHAATTPPLKSVEASLDSFMVRYGSVHRGAGQKSQISTNRYEHTRKIIRDFVNAPKDSYVLFTGNTTGAMNTLSYFLAFLSGRIAVSAIEHSSSWLPFVKAEGVKLLGAKQGSLFEMEKINKRIQIFGQRQVCRYQLNSQGEFDLTDIERILQQKKIKALVVTASSNLTGYCPDLKKISRLVHRYGALFVVDACQYLQHHPLDMEKMGIDFLAASGHKFYAPYGGGFLIGPKKFLDRFLSYQIGGGNLPYITRSGVFLRYPNQLAHDPGTPNAGGAITMAAALKTLKKIGLKKIERYEIYLSRRAYEAMRRLPKIKMFVTREKLNSVIPFVIQGKNSSEVARRLNEEFGIGVRAGNFCVYEAVRNMLNLKNEKQITRAVRQGRQKSVPGLIRISLGLSNRPSDITRLIKALKIIST